MSDILHRCDSVLLNKSPVVGYRWLSLKHKDCHRVCKIILNSSWPYLLFRLKKSHIHFIEQTVNIVMKVVTYQVKWTKL